MKLTKSLLSFLLLFFSMVSSAEHGWGEWVLDDGLEHKVQRKKSQVGIVGDDEQLISELDDSTFADDENDDELDGDVEEEDFEEDDVFDEEDGAEDESIEEEDVEEDSLEEDSMEEDSVEEEGGV